MPAVNAEMQPGKKNYNSYCIKRFTVTIFLFSVYNHAKNFFTASYINSIHIILTYKNSNNLWPFLSLVFPINL